jgi:hypothetical protein
LFRLPEFDGQESTRPARIPQCNNNIENSSRHREDAAVVEGDFDRWTLANMNAALDEVCGKCPRGEEHAIRKRIAKQIIKCAKGGRTTLGELTAAAERALIEIAGRGAGSSEMTHRENRAQSA